MTNVLQWVDEGKVQRWEVKSDAPVPRVGDTVDFAAPGRGKDPAVAFYGKVVDVCWTIRANKTTCTITCE